MPVLKCKMCGGNLQVEEGQTVCECEYCGTRQTVPVLDDEKKNKLYERANKLRFNCEFDKAFNVYQQITNDFSDEAEAYWGMILCRYGIEYVEDPVTRKRIPTCHRSSFESVLDDEDFDLVMENADGAARGIYREEAKAIEEIRKGIIEVSSKEEPYDIFICYKETDEYGDRTIDSVIAQDVYTALTDKGYKVFFSRITLEDKLGQEYEPYIFAALNSAKVMLAFGTSYDYYNAVWVKNEWSRYLDLMKKDKNKYLIPCFKGIDAYDMPKEFAHLQAQDMGKVGALQDLLRGIDKIFHKDEKKNITIQNYGGQSLTDKAKMFLEVGAWKSANEISEQLLDIDDNDAEAYLIKLLIDLKLQDKEKLQSLEKPFDDNENYQKILKTKNEKIKKYVVDAVQAINDRNYNNSLEAKYQNALKRLEHPKNKSNNEKAISILREISDYKDSLSLIKKAEANISAINRRNKRTIIVVCIAIALCLSGFGVFKFVSSNNIYNEAVTALNNGDYFTAYSLFFKVGGFKDSKAKGEEAFKEYYKNVRVGDVIKLGHYEQDNDDKNGTEPIEWIVISKEDNGYTLLSKYVLFAEQMFDEDSNKEAFSSAGAHLFVKSSLFENLNSSFYDTTFSEKEKEIIKPVVIGKRYGEEVLGKVSVLSEEALDTLLPNMEDQTCYPTDFAVKNGAYKSSENGMSWYWTSTYKSSSDKYVRINEGGKHIYVSPTTKNGGVRPTITIYISD